ncbi:hypothetical protein Rsub_01704 [Raphidocelis subcapitata]|uniref:DJ-1/PfpI domain-containing protein n=1 Tax=Raphidocelis subcapitata TaxID=307507 RepID=A0A2V0NTD1_9CHLO|nr:hypothetical protein Rsub_01704 [Raphidocelis subcapitata]|eukprot:GBF88803.1 hypothetical protein Rsub_01704 [Raphidocelis subcapitata]
MSHKAVHESELSKAAVLVVATSCGAFEDGTPTGLWLSELAEPYYAFRAAGYDVTIASPRGGAVPLDPASLEGEAATPAAHRFLEDAEANAQLRSTVPLEGIQQPASYDCIFLPGGHGPMYDLAGDERLGRVLSEANAAGACIAAVCHGPAGLLSARDASGRRPLLEGRRVAGFTAEEERAVGNDKQVPFLLDARLSEASAALSPGPAWRPRVEVDGNLVTGQNPASALPVAEAALRAMGAR